MTRWPSVVRSVVQHVKLGRAKRSVPMLRRRWISSSSQSSRGTTVTERSPRPTTSLTTCSSVPAEVWPRWRRLLESQSPTTAICGCGPIRCGGRLRDGACRCPDRQTAVFGRPVRDPSPGRSAALTAAFGTELTAGELHGLKDGRGDSPPLRLSWLRRALEKRLPRESDLVPMPAAKGSASHTREIPSQPGSRGTRSARGGPGRRPAPRWGLVTGQPGRVDDSKGRARDAAERTGASQKSPQTIPSGDSEREGQKADPAMPNTC
jgi:hypothetical protein